MIRKFHSTKEDRWRSILKVLQWNLEMRIHAVQRAQASGQAAAYRIYMPLLKESYLNSRFLHMFLGYTRETKAEQLAKNLLQ